MLYLYTDGSSTGKVGEGGAAFVLTDDDNIIFEKSFGQDQTTNNRMELLGVIEGLRFVYQNYPINTPFIVRSDSQYVIKGINIWMASWLSKIERGKKIKNQDLWLELKELVEQFPRIKLEWIQGHAGNLYNERCDTLAKQAKLDVKKNRQCNSTLTKRQVST